MMLEKRARGPMIKRTTSMSSGMSIDGGDVEAPTPLDPQNPIMISNIEDHETKAVGSAGLDYRSYSALLSPRYYKRPDSAHHHHHHQPHFLRSCGLCSRRLTPGRDIYMYRGDTAFCSQECREQQMKHDERKEKCTNIGVPKKIEGHYNHSDLATAASEASSNGETVAAA